MATYPNLQALGVTDPEAIDRYSLQTVDNVDVLRIIYRRQEGEILPASKKFRFGRAERYQRAEGGSQIPEVTYEVSPVVSKLMAELDQIVAAKHSKAHRIEVIEDELRRLQEENHHRIAYIRKLIGELD